MSLSVEIETTGLEDMFRFYGEVKQKTLPETLRIHARLLCVELARRTQPFGNDQKVGEKAIARDLLGGKKRYGLFAPITGFMAANAKEYSSGNIRLFAKKDGTVYGTDKAHFMKDASTSTIRKIHKGAFVNGSMSSAGSRTRDIGRWKFIDKYFVPENTLDEYVKSQQKKTGLAKSGWADCAKKLKSPLKGSATRGIPRWVTRHLKDYGFGRVEDMADDQRNPRITLTNTCRYTDKVCRESERDVAVLIIVNKMIKQLANIMRYERKKLPQAA
jgi:hypothetical protein